MNGTTYATKRVIKAPIERVFDAWTDPEIIKNWFPPQDPDWNCVIFADAQVGGRYRFELNGPEDQFIVFGEFTEVARNERLVFTWMWETASEAEPATTVEINFAATEAGTEVSLVHSGFPAAEIAALHEDGWGKCFTRLEEFLS